MILRTRQGANYEARDMFSQASKIPPPGYRSGAGMGGGDALEAVPAAGAAVRLLAETTGQLPVVVRTGRRGDPSARPDPNAWEAGVLAQPNLEQSPFDTWSYAIASLQRGGAFFLKSKDGRGRVAELFVMDPGRVRAKVRDGVVVFEVRDKGRTKTLDRSDVIYVPGYLCKSPFIGSSVVENYATAIGAALALEQFQLRYFDNDAEPGGIITLPGSPKKAQRDEFRESWEARHKGNPGAVGILWGGATYDSVAINLVDAQFIESQGWSVAQVARMYRVPLKKLTGEEDATDPEVENQNFATYSLQPWASRLEQGLSMDRDLFPDGSRHAAFDLTALLRGNFTTRAKSYREARQGGWLTANEIRRGEGYEDHPEGDQLQKTPVGGAPNPGAGESQ